jgi:Zn finger protein HypA/HybF involved in hydrogenase expression
LTPTEKRTPVDAKATCERCNRFSRLPDVVVLDLVEPGDDGVVRIHVELEAVPQGCPSCGVVAHVKDRRRVELVEVLDEFGPNSPGRLLVLVYDLLVTDPVAEVRKRLEDRRSDFTCTSHLSLTASLPRDGAFTQVTGSDLHAATRVQRESKTVEPSAYQAEELPEKLRCPFPDCGELVVDNECFSMHESVLTTGTDGRLTRVPREWQTAEPSKYPAAELPEEFSCPFPGCPGLVMRGRCSFGHESVMSTGGEGQPTRGVLADGGEGDSEPSPAVRQAMYDLYVDFEDEEGDETFGMSLPKSAPSEAA